MRYTRADWQAEHALKAKDFASRSSRKGQETRAMQWVFEGAIYRSHGIGCDDYKGGCCNSSLSVGLDLLIAVFLVVRVEVQRRRNMLERGTM